jgi:hypothetical protein
LIDRFPTLGDSRLSRTTKEGVSTSSSEGGQVTGTQDKDYNFIWFTEQCLSNARRLQTYIQEAERAGDNELGFFAERRARAARAVSRASSCWVSAASSLAIPPDAARRRSRFD